MAVFNKTHVAEIENRIKKAGVTNQVLFEDMVDHYCCAVEEDMQKGIEFEASFKKAWNNISPNGLIEIEHELFFILNFNKHIQMKKLLYGSGFLSATFIATGFLFRILNWPGAIAVSFLGYAFLFLVCLLIVISQLKSNTPANKKIMLRFYAGVLTALFISVGSMFKGLRWPGANMITLVGFLFLVFFFLPVFFYNAYKSSINNQLN